MCFCKDLFLFECPVLHVYASRRTDRPVSALLPGCTGKPEDGTGHQRPRGDDGTTACFLLPAVKAHKRNTSAVHTLVCTALVFQQDFGY